MKRLVFAGFIVFCLFLFYSAFEMREFGDPPSNVNEMLPGADYEVTMDDRIIGSYDNATNDWEYGAVKETGANNAVTSVVFDYRGYDTLGEATVLFTAIAGIMLLFRREKK
jgi:hypothetical protein